KHIEIGSALYNRLRIGNTVQIKYLPSDPNISVLTASDTDDTERNNGILATSLTVPPCLLIAGLMLFNDRKNRILSKGQLLPGKIISAQAKPGNKGAYLVTIDYSFADAYGQQLTRKQTQNRPDLRKTSLPTAG